MLHEVGSVYVPAQCSTSRPPSATPRRQPRSRPREVAGYRLRAGPGFPRSRRSWLLRARERYDGSGPEGMRRETIPIESRILRAAETCRAALETSPGLEGMQPHRRAIQVLAREAGTTLDPDVTAALVAALEGRPAVRRPPRPRPSCRPRGRRPHRWACRLAAVRRRGSGRFALILWFGRETTFSVDELVVFMTPRIRGCRACSNRPTATSTSPRGSSMRRSCRHSGPTTCRSA